MKILRKKLKKIHFFRVGAVAVYVCLFVLVVMLMRYVQLLLNTDLKINLMEVVTQNKDVITSRLALEMNEMEALGNRLVDRMKREGNGNFEDLREVFWDYSNSSLDSNIYISDLEGNAVFYDKSKIDISGRRYFKLASEGVDNISDRIISRKNGEDIFVFSVPLMDGDRHLGTLQKHYSPDEMYNLCALSLYSSEGYMYIVNKEGYILISTNQNEYSRENENYFRMLYAQGNQKESEQLQKDIENERDGFMELAANGERTFSAYTPIKDVHDWYLISSVSTEAVSSNSAIVIKIFYLILVVMVIILGASLLAFLAYKNRQQDNLKRIAFVDDVTLGNTYNRFINDVGQLLQEQKDKTYYLLKFDIDNFKYINNFYGFDTGDKILRKIYQSIEHKLHQGELIARISSDNFIVFLNDAGEERLKDILESTDNDEGISIRLSSGLYEITDPSESINLMVDKASAAAQFLKSSFHKKTCVYSEEFDLQMIRNEQMKRALERAIADNEMVPFYQAKVDVNSGKIVGAEALCRWITGEGKMVSPGEFIPVCEKTGFVTEVDFIIFDKVLHYQHRKLSEGAECVPISVNFSRLHLMDRDFVQKVSRKICEYKVPPKLIEVELTESTMFENLEAVIRIITELHSEGILVSMDDFGSGYSSLNMLKDIPIDVLKIDKGFLDATADGRKQWIIFSTIVTMAKLLDIEVVVEGVELLEQVELMKEVGCDIAQGYYYSKPIDEACFEGLCREGLG